MILWQFGRNLRDEGKRMRRLKRRDDAFKPSAELKRVKRFLICRSNIFRTPYIIEPGMFRPDARIVEPRRNGMAITDLAVFVLQQIGAVAVKHTRLAALERGAVLAGLDALARRFHAVNLHGRIIEERMEQAHRIGAATDAGNDGVRQASL